MFCPSCGKEATLGAKFCTECGKRLPEEVNAPVDTSPVDSSPIDPPKKKKIPVKFILALVILVAVLALGGKLLSGFISGNGGGGKGSIVAVTNPNFRLSDGFIVPVEQQESAPTGFIPISTATEFDKIRQNPSADYILMDDIDLSGWSWTPIKQFNGTLDGNGYTVSGLNATLIEETKDALIQNLSVQGQITGDGAGIVHELKDSVLYNCCFAGSVDNDGGYAAGLVVTINDSTVDSCYNTANITASKGYTAGLAARGFGDRFVIQNCFNQGNICNLGNSTSSTSYNYAAGILARSERCSGTIRHCYNTGAIRCKDNNSYPLYSYYGDAIACGILSYANVPDGENLSVSMCYNSGAIEGGDLAFGIGLAWGTSALRTQVNNCYNSGEFVHSNSYGIAGCVSDSGNIVDLPITYCYNASTTGAAAISNNSTNLYQCYYLDEVSEAVPGGPLFSDVFALSAHEMAKKDSFAFDFDTVWTMGKGDYSYPVFGYRNFEIVDAIA